MRSWRKPSNADTDARRSVATSETGRAAANADTRHTAVAAEVERERSNSALRVRNGETGPFAPRRGKVVVAAVQGQAGADAAERESKVVRARKTRAARLSVASNAAFVVVKLVVGLSSGSVGVLSEALHSATDLVASGIAYFSVRQADAPPDDDHPYGHGKIESVSGLAEALLIFIAAAVILYEAIHQLAAPAPEETPPVGAGLVVMTLSIVVNVALSRHLRRVATETDSLALQADSEHLRTDVVTSIGVLVGLILVRVTHRAWFDPVTAILVALLILRTSTLR